MLTKYDIVCDVTNIYRTISANIHPILQMSTGVE